MRKGLQDMHRLQELVRLHRMGLPARQIADRLQLARKTERKYRERLSMAGLLAGSLDDLPELVVLRAAVASDAETPPQERSSVEAYADAIMGHMNRGIGPTAIHALLREDHAGFNGSLSAVKRLYKRLKRARGPAASDVAIPVHTESGQQAQVDFGFVGRLVDPETGKQRKAWVFVMVLSHSRAMYARIVFDQSIETWLDLHRRAFAFFGGVPHVVVPDNLKAAVIRAVFDAESMGALNRSYRDFARHYGFSIDPTPAYSPEKKGKVESAVKYVKGSFFKPRADRLVGVEDANRRLDAWVRDTANQRVHGTTRKVPADALHAEQADLLPAPSSPFVAVLWHKATVERNSHVTCRRRFYSVPWVHLGKEAWLRVCGTHVTIFVDDERVADHGTEGPTPWSTVQEHLPEGRRDFADRDPKAWFARADALHEDVGVYVRAVMDSDEVHYPLRRVQSIVRTLESLTPDRAASVARHAARFACYDPRSVRKIVKDAYDLRPSESEYVSADWATEPRFARQATSFLQGGRFGTH